MNVNRYRIIHIIYYFIYIDNFKSSLKKYIINTSYNPPLNWQVLLSFLLMHQVIGVEDITQNSYERSFNINNSIGFLKITNHEPNLIVEVLAADKLVLPIIEQKVRKMFDLELNANILAKQFSQHLLLKHIYAQYPALRIPGSWDAFETAINTIVSQLISVAAARKTLAKLVTKYGKQITHPNSKLIMYLFPSAQVLLDSDLSSLGLTNIKIKAIKELSKKVVSEEIDLENRDLKEIKNDLLKITGIGPWTVEYLAMRCSRHKDAFPKNDLILKRYVKNYPELEQFKELGSYLAIYLWQHHLTSK